MKRLEGLKTAKGLKFGIVVSKYNGEITSALLEGALGVLRRAEVAQSDITIITVPGVFEIPLFARNLAATPDGVDAVITLGCVLRGETAHFDQICTAATTEIQRAAIETGIPITHGILMTENEKQAVARAGGSWGNRGEEAALAAVETATLMQQLSVAGV